jgi:hypothetical protein
MLTRLVSALAALAFATSAVAAPQCDYNPNATFASPPWSRNQCPRECVVNYSGGGIIHDFKNAAMMVKRSGRSLRIAGDCISACTVAADKARPNVCITPAANFQFHNGYLGKTRFDMSDEYSRDIRRWIARKGGLPGKDVCDDTLLIMNNREARQFFPLCQG